MCSRSDRITALLRSGLFCMLLVLPGIQLLFAPIDLAAYELPEFKRSALPRPSIKSGDMFGYLDRFERYFEKNFGFRDYLVRAQASLRFHVLGVSPTPRVLKGKEGWFFYSGNEILAFFQGTNRFSARELETIQEVYEARYRYLSSLGIRYFLVVVPNKESIYPEYFPDGILRVHPQGRYDQFVEHMRLHSEVPVVDLKPALLERKSLTQLYRKSDGHWNNVGAFIGYEEIVKRLQEYFPKLEPLTLQQFKMVSRMEIGDLGRMMGLLTDPTFATPKLIPLRGDPWYDQGFSSRGENQPLTIDRRVKIHGASGENEAMERHLLVYRDSFFAAIAPFISQHFVVSDYYTTHRYFFDPFVIEQRRPQVVIDQVIERYLEIPQQRELALMRHRISGKPLADYGKLIFGRDAFASTPDGKLASPVFKFKENRSYALHISSAADRPLVLMLQRIGTGKAGAVIAQEKVTLPAGTNQTSVRLLEIKDNRALALAAQEGDLRTLTDIALREF